MPSVAHGDEGNVIGGYCASMTTVFSPEAGVTVTGIEQKLAKGRKGVSRCSRRILAFLAACFCENLGFPRILA